MKVETVIRTLDEVCGDRHLPDASDPGNLIAVNDARKATFESNPFLVGRDSQTQMLGIAEKEVIGKLNVFPLEIVADGEVLSATCGDSLFVRDEYRRTLYALTLMDRLNKISADKISLSAGFSAKAQELIKIMRNIVFPLRQFIVVRHSRAIFSTFGRFHFLRRFAWLFDAMLIPYRLGTKVVARFALNGFERVEISVDDEFAIGKFAELIKQDKHRFRENVTSKWIDWVLRNDFHSDRLIAKRLFGFRRNGEFVAFVMTRESREGNGMLGSVIEWQTKSGFEKYEKSMLMDVMQHILSRLDCVAIAVGGQDAGAYHFAQGFLPGLGRSVVSIGVGGKDSSLKRYDGHDVLANWRLRTGMGDLCFSYV